MPEDYATLTKEDRDWLARHRRLKLEPAYHGKNWSPGDNLTTFENRVRVFVLTPLGNLRLLQEIKLKGGQA